MFIEYVKTPSTFRREDLCVYNSETNIFSIFGTSSVIIIRELFVFLINPDVEPDLEIKVRLSTHAMISQSLS